jgi:hypothetical protein
MEENQELIIYEKNVTTYIENEFAPKFMNGEECKGKEVGHLGSIFWLNFDFILNDKKIRIYFQYDTIKDWTTILITKNLGKKHKLLVKEVKVLEESFMCLNKAMNRMKLEGIYK